MNDYQLTINGHESIKIKAESPSDAVHAARHDTRFDFLNVSTTDVVKAIKVAVLILACLLVGCKDAKPDYNSALLPVVVYNSTVMDSWNEGRVDDTREVVLDHAEFMIQQHNMLLEDYPVEHAEAHAEYMEMFNEMKELAPAK